MHHNPQTIVENLRDHLASTDRPLGFLFGSGTSASINVAPEPEPNEKPTFEPLIPAIEGLTKLCQKAIADMGDAFGNAWCQMVSQCEDDESSPNIENVLSRVRSKIRALGKDEKLIGLSKPELENVEKEIQKTIAEVMTVGDDAIPEDIPHRGFAEWVGKAGKRASPIEVFTTNYDILFERSLEYARVPVFDGFIGTHSPFFSADSLERKELEPPSSWLRLWKIHGSVNWKRVECGESSRVVRGAVTETGEMILPSEHKYDESRKQPYTALLERLKRFLDVDHSLLVTCGYSFGDQHINAVLMTVLENRPTANVISLQYDNLGEESDLAKLAKMRTNLTVLAPNIGVISGDYGEWRLLKPVDEQTHSFMDLAFDSNAPEPTEDSGTAGEKGGNSLEDESCMGKVRLGDFNWFCKCLGTMTPSDGSVQ